MESTMRSIITSSAAACLAVLLLGGMSTDGSTASAGASATVKNTPAAFLVPILRPMLPQMAQLAAYPCSNSLLIVDSSANVKRIEAVVKALDVGAPYKPAPCEAETPGTHHHNPATHHD
jgi:Bacterial type II/III secretion system short domain